MRHQTFAFLLSLSLLLTGCFSSTPEDPFEQLPKEETITLEGEIFPFSVAVSTRATHRLEKNHKLQAYLASEVMQLEAFEGINVEVTGVIQKEKMREILWVQSVRIQEDTENNEDLSEQMFQTKDFAFRYPGSWSYTTAPNAMAYFSEKDDTGRVVFFTFSVEETQKRESIDPDIMVSSLVGNKVIRSLEGGKERQTISLYSNLYDQKYIFTFTHSPRESEKKKAFQRLLNSFVEGPEGIKAALTALQKEKAVKEAKKLEAIRAEEAVDNEKLKIKNEKLRNDSSESIETANEDPASPLPSSPASPSSDTAPKPTFSTIIDERAFFYTSPYYGFEMRVPYGYWFQNFGPSEGRITIIGFSDEGSLEGDLKKSQFTLEIIGDPDNTLTAGETKDDTTVTILFPHSRGKFFRLQGPITKEGAMRSVQGTVKTD